MDASPATKGHALVLPKEHYANIYEIDPEVLGKAVRVGQKVIQHVTPILNCDGYNLLQNNGEVAGQTVFHFHLHLISRYKDADNSNVLTKLKMKSHSGGKLWLYNYITGRLRISKVFPFHP